MKFLIISALCAVLALLPVGLAAAYGEPHALIWQNTPEWQDSESVWLTYIDGTHIHSEEYIFRPASQKYEKSPYTFEGTADEQGNWSGTYYGPSEYPIEYQGHYYTDGPLAGQWELFDNEGNRISGWFTVF